MMLIQFAFGNTAHFFAETEEYGDSASALPRKRSRGWGEMGLRKAGLLATDGTIKGRVLPQGAAQVRRPDNGSRKEGQEDVMKAIYRRAKAGNLKLSRELLLKIVKRLEKRVDKLIAGCTEVSVH